MKIRVLGGSGGMSPGRLLISFRINDGIILDAGSVAQALTLDEQLHVHHIILTHAHLDHSGNLPFFVDNIFGLRQEPFIVHALPETIASVRDHLFNNDIWPDFSMLPDFRRAQMRFSELTEEKSVRVGDIELTPVRVAHTIPAAGFLLEDETGTVVFSGDTGPTERIWELAAARPNLKALFIETSFPNRMQAIADVSAHLTPQTLRQEIPKLGRDLPVFVYHIKPRFHDEVVREIGEIDDYDITCVEQDGVYEF